MDGLLKKVRSGVHLGRWRLLRVLGRQELPRVCLLGLMKHLSGLERPAWQLPLLLSPQSSSLWEIFLFTPSLLYEENKLQSGAGGKDQVLTTPGSAHGALDEVQALVLHLGVPGTPILSKFRCPAAII